MHVDQQHSSQQQQQHQRIQEAVGGMVHNPTHQAAIGAGDVFACHQCGRQFLDPAQLVDHVERCKADAKSSCVMS